MGAWILTSVILATSLLGSNLSHAVTIRQIPVNRESVEQIEPAKGMLVGPPPAHSVQGSVEKAIQPSSTNYQPYSVVQPYSQEDAANVPYTKTLGYNNNYPNGISRAEYGNTDQEFNSVESNGETYNDDELQNRDVFLDTTGYKQYESHNSFNLQGPKQLETIESKSYHKESEPFETEDYSKHHHKEEEEHAEVHYHQHKHLHKHQHKQDHMHKHKEEHKHEHDHKHHSEAHHEHKHKNEHKHHHHNEHKHEHHSKHEHKHKQEHKHDHHHGHHHEHKHDEKHKHDQEHKHKHEHWNDHKHKHWNDHKHDHHHDHKHSSDHKHKHKHENHHKHEHKQEHKHQHHESSHHKW